MTMHTRRAAATGLLTLLVACGGGGGGGGTGPVIEPPLTGTGVCQAGGATVLVNAAQAQVGQQTAVGILGCTVTLASVQWTQLSGPSVPLLSNQTQLIHFEPTAAGSYGFRVTSVDTSGVSRSQELTLTVTAPATPVRALVRGHQAVRMGGKASMRAWAASGETLKSVTWDQLEGPTVTLADVDSLAKQFTAPQVTQDTLLRFKATLTTASGTDTQEVVVVVEKVDQAPANNNAFVWSGSHVSRVHPYVAASPYAGALTRCTYDPQLTAGTACTLGQLPLLGQDSAGALPSVEQVMNHVLVSHDWLGANFEAFLRTSDTRGDFRRMLMSTTAIVLGAHVRPSFYHPATGAIYLDAANFWMTPEQRDTIDEAPDYRSSFGNALAYAGLWRYAKDNQRFIPSLDVLKRLSRSDADVLGTAGWLLYHELSHAGDFIPAAQFASLRASDTVTAITADRYSRHVLASDLMAGGSPLTSTELTGLAQVNFFGATPTATQKAYTADQIGQFFAADVAVDPYAYGNSREDLAMTVEETLMSLRLGARRDVAFVARDADGPVTSNVRWGQRGRVGDARLHGRIKTAAAVVAPWLDLTQVDALPLPLSMRVGESWTANLVLGPTASPVLRTAQAARDEARAFGEWLAVARDREAAHQQVERWLRR